MIRALALLAVSAAPVLAEPIALEACTRTTHVSHGGEALHRDMGEGRVAWIDWWSQEGSAVDIVLMDCAPGDALRFRTAEENMSARPPINKTERAWAIVEREHAGARVFATLERIATAVAPHARDVKITRLSEETCACAALYPAQRGNKQSFELGNRGVQP